MPQVTSTNSDEDQYLADLRERLWPALCAYCGPDLAEEAVSDTLVYAWQNRARIDVMENPLGYLYTVARSRVRWQKDQLCLMPQPATIGLPDIEPALPQALAQLTESQRVSVFLVEGLGWPVIDVARLWGVSESTVRNHVRRGMDSLRASMGVEP